MLSVVRIFAAFYVFLSNIEAFIHRLPCRLYGKFDVKYLNKNFNSSSKIIFNNVTIEMCAMNCIAPNISATALNYFYENSTCEIFNHSFIYFQRENQLLSHIGSVFMTTTHDITKRGYKCSEMATSPCGEDEGCVDDCSQLGYKCIKLYLNQNQITVKSDLPSQSPAVIDNDFDTELKFKAPENWIKLDMDKKYNIYYLKIKSREISGSKSRFIHIGNVNENPVNNPLCAEFVNTDTVFKISCTSGDEIRYAQYIYIYREGNERNLLIYEVRVFTDYIQ